MIFAEKYIINIHSHTSTQLARYSGACLFSQILERLRQDEDHEFMVSLGYIEIETVPQSKKHKGLVV